MAPVGQRRSGRARKGGAAAGLAARRRWLGVVILALCLLPAARMAVAAGGLPVVDAGGFYNVNLPSFQDSKFHRVIRQAHDFSCGSAAIATLLTYHYGRTTTEREVLDEMMLFGDTEQIIAQGFSMGDMVAKSSAPRWCTACRPRPPIVHASLGTTRNPGEKRLARPLQ